MKLLYSSFNFWQIVLASGSNAYVNVFQHTTTYQNSNRTQLKETAGHEFGHVTDYPKNHSGNADFGNYTVHAINVLRRWLYEEILAVRNSDFFAFIKRFC